MLLPFYLHAQTRQELPKTGVSCIRVFCGCVWVSSGGDSKYPALTVPLNRLPDRKKRAESLASSVWTSGTSRYRLDFSTPQFGLPKSRRDKLTDMKVLLVELWSRVGQSVLPNWLGITPVWPSRCFSSHNINSQYMWFCKYLKYQILWNSSLRRLTQSIQ